MQIDHIYLTQPHELSGFLHVEIPIGIFDATTDLIPYNMNIEEFC